MNLKKLSFSATTVKPDVCCRSKPEGLWRLPVDKKYSSAFPRFSFVFRKMAMGKSLAKVGDVKDTVGFRLR